MKGRYRGTTANANQGTDARRCPLPRPAQSGEKKKPTTRLPLSTLPGRRALEEELRNAKLEHRGGDAALDDGTSGNNHGRRGRGRFHHSENSGSGRNDGFEPAYETFAPMHNADARKVKYRPPDLRVNCRDNLASQNGSVSNLHCDDMLRRVSVVFHRHVLVYERRQLLLRQEARNDCNNGSSANGGSAKRCPGSCNYSQDWNQGDENLDEMDNDANLAFESSNIVGQLDGGRRMSAVSRGSRTSSIGTQNLGSPGALAGNGRSVCSWSQGEYDNGLGGTNTSNDGLRGALGNDADIFENATETLNEDAYLRSQYKYSFILLPRLPLWTPYRMQRVMRVPEVPTVEQIYSFIRHLFVEAELSSECSVVCLVYVERLMERAGVQLLATNWRPIIMVGMLLASKVWQDLSSWNIEFARIYPQFSVKSINRLERNVLKLLQWDLFISGAVYAKYYFALRSLNESRNFRSRYNYLIKVNAPNSKHLEKRSAQASNSLYSRSM